MRIKYDYKYKRAVVESNDEYYFVHKSDIHIMEELNLETMEALKPDHIFIYLFCIMELLFILLSILLYILHRHSISAIAENNLLSVAVLIFNIILHESGHFLLMTFYGEKVNRLGITFIFLFPAVYVRTSNSYFLSKYRRIAVYLAGLFGNSIYVTISLLLFQITKCEFYYYTLKLIIITMLYNMIPIIKTDGYYALNVLRSKYNKKSNFKFLNSFFRGFLVFMLFKIIDWYMNS